MLLAAHFLTNILICLILLPLIRPLWRVKRNRLPMLALAATLIAWLLYLFLRLP